MEANEFRGVFHARFSRVRPRWCQARRRPRVWRVVGIHRLRKNGMRACSRHVQKWVATHSFTCMKVIRPLCQRHGWVECGRSVRPRGVSKVVVVVVKGGRGRRVARQRLHGRGFPVFFTIQASNAHSSVSLVLSPRCARGYIFVSQVTSGSPFRSVTASMRTSPSPRAPPTPPRRQAALRA